MSDLTEAQIELATLKTKADTLGVEYSPNIGAEKLRERISAKLAEQDSEDAKVIAEEPKVVETQAQLYERLRMDALRMVRVNVSPMDPALKEYDGDFFSVTNGVVRTVRKYVKFNTSDGWHIPNIIYQQLINATCQIFVNVPDERTGGKAKKKQGKLVPRFSVQVLPDLTEEELAKLEADQKARGAID